jgi:hypothetical protein
MLFVLTPRGLASSPLLIVKLANLLGSRISYGGALLSVFLLDPQIMQASCLKELGGKASRRKGGELCMRIRIVMYGGIVTGVYMLGDSDPNQPWLRLEEECDYKIDQYPLEDLVDRTKRKSK